MCIAIYKPTKANVTDDVLCKCWQANPDGGGFMYASAGVVMIFKGYMKLKHFRRAYRRHEAKNPDANFVLHFRIGTHGARGPENTHPFRVASDVGFVHNGILKDICVPKDSALSDTAIFVRDVLQCFPADFLTRGGFKLLLQATAEHEGQSRFVFLDGEGTAHIFNEKNGAWRNGCWFSNEYWLPSVRCGFSLVDGGYGNGHIKELNVDYSVKYDDWRECAWCGDWYPAPTGIQSDEPTCDACMKQLQSGRWAI